MRLDLLVGMLATLLLCGPSAAQNNAAPTPSATGNWRLVGPTAAEPMKDAHGGDVGRINTFAFHPTQPNTLYAASPSGGLWETQDNGASWQLLKDFRPLGLQEIAIDPTNPNTMYALTGDGDGRFKSEFSPPSVGVLKSTDGGKTWSATGLKFSPDDFVSGYRLAIDPANPQILLAATSQGLYRTENGGQTWPKVTAGIATTDIQLPLFYDVQFHPTNPQIIYAASMTQVYRSSNGGLNWTLLSKGLPPYRTICTRPMPFCPTANANYSDRIRLAVTPASPNTLYVLYGSPMGFTVGLYRSDDQGNSFTKRSSSTPRVRNGPPPINLTKPNIFGRVDNDFASQSNYDIAMAVSPTNADIVHVGGVDTWLSSDGGRTWTRTSYWDQPNSPHYTHADIHMLAYHGGSSSPVLYVASDGGIYRSTSNPDDKAAGVSFVSITNLVTEALSGSITVAQTYHVCASPQQPDQLYYGAQDNGAYALDFNSGKIRWVAGGDGYICQVDPQNPKTLYVNMDQIIERIDDSTNAVWPQDETGMKLATPSVGGQPLTYPSDAPWVVPYIFGPPPNYGLYACYADLWRSNDHGDHWTNLTHGALGPSVQCTQVAVSPADPKTIYVAKQAGDASDAQRLALLPPMLGGFGVFRSTDAGATWRRVNGAGANALPLAWKAAMQGGKQVAIPGGQITDLAVSPADPRRVWVTFSGYGYNSAYKVFATTDGGANWTDLSNGLPQDHPAYSVMAASGTAHGVYIGTDAGIYYRDDTASTWTKFKDGLPDVPVYAMLLQEPQHRLLAATYGRGIWAAELNGQ